MMRFSILIPTFKRADLLRQAIESALAQSHPNREIVVIDDGSPDETKSVVETFGPAIRYLRQENRGKSAALNRGIAASDGDAIIVLDDDDLFPPWTVARHAEALERNADASFSYGRYLRFRGTTLPPASELRDKEFMPVHDPRRVVVKLMENCFLPNPAWAARREAQLRVGPYDERLFYSQDYDMLLRHARMNDGAFIDDFVLYQRRHYAHRGPASDPAYIDHSVDKWVKYDALIFQKIDREWGLADFRPFSDEVPLASDEALALLQKGVVLFHRKVYEGGMRALTEYHRHLDARPPTPIELSIAYGLLGCCHGIADLVTVGPIGTEFIRWMRSGKWPVLMRAAFASQLRWRLRIALARGDARYALQLVQFSSRAFGAAATTAVFGSRYSFGTRPWRRSD